MFEKHDNVAGYYRTILVKGQIRTKSKPLDTSLLPSFIKPRLTSSLCLLEVLHIDAMKAQKKALLRFQVAGQCGQLMA